jgi:hypothetical protein
MTAQPEAGEQGRAGLPGLAELTAGELSAVTSAAVGRPVTVRQTRVTPVGYDWGSPATAGLWRVDVSEQAGAGGPDVSSYFVKLLRDTRLWPGLRQMPAEAAEEFVSFFPWRAELDMHESGIGDVLPPGMRTPQLHRVKQAGPDHIALWWEYVDQRPGRWQLADYALAAGLLGRLAARRREGAEVNRLLPPVARDRPPGGSSLRYYTERRVQMSAIPALRDGQFWNHPVMAAALSQAADPGLPADMLVLARRVPRILDMLDDLPQTHAHGDASPQNLLVPAAEPDTLVVIDWGFGSLLPVGFDLGQLLVGLAHAGEADPSDLAAIDAAIFPAYLAGLAAENYDAATADVRAGYIGGLAARSALCALPLELLAGQQVPEQAQQLIERRLRLTRVMLDLASELRLTGD